MLVTGRGSIAQVQYTGDEAAADIRKLLDTVIANEDEYDPWTALVNRASELEGGVTRNSNPSAVELVRNVLDCFLAKFPLFFGFWRRYAELEFSIGGTETAEMVYERGVSCIPSSVDLWKEYCGFKMETCHEPDVVRDLFERAAEFVGQDFQSPPFWDKYIEFEERAGDASHVTKIHERLMHFPTFSCDKYFPKFRTAINSRPLEELTDPSRLEAFTNEVVAGDDGSPAKSELEIDRLIRGKIDAFYYELFSRTHAEMTKRWELEHRFNRGFFHVTDLDNDELDNWRKYLDLEESEGDFKRVSLLYERCVVACALYEEFWLRYARWTFAQGKEEDTRLIYMRASSIFVPIALPTVRLHWARFEEKLGRIQVARDIHIAILDELPDHVETIISLAGLERRHEGDQAAIQYLENYINQCNDQLAGQLTVEQARILWQCSAKPEEARQLFNDRHEQYPESQDFWVNYLKFEISQPPVDEKESHAHIKKAYELMCTKAHFSASTLKDLSHYYMEYLLARGGKEAAQEYMVLDKELNGAKPLPEINAEVAEDDQAANGHPQ